VGFGMGTGLYDAAFAALGKLYGAEARVPITNLTLIGGFASTVCWPLSAFLAETFGWRGACFVYAALHLGLSLPLQMAVMPPLTQTAGAAGGYAAGDPERRAAIPSGQWLPFVLLASILTVASGIGSIVIVHFMIFLQARGADLALAVALGTLFGPSQVAARIVERLFGARYHPIWTMVASGVLMALGLAMLLGEASWLVLTVVIYGSGYGIMWIARGTLPLALFGADRYATLMGRLAFPALIVQALAPSAGAWMVERHGADAALAALTALAVLNVALIAILWLLCWPRGPAI